MFSRYYRLFGAAVLLSFCVGGDLPAQSSADWDWMSNHFDKALHDLFPIDERYGIYVAYRSHRDLHTDVSSLGLKSPIRFRDCRATSPRT
jgi:hypothetical protein